MDNTKDNRYYLDRILTDLRFIIAHTQDLDQEDLEENEVLQDSVMFRLIQISENSDRHTGLQGPTSRNCLESSERYAKQNRP